MAPLCSFSRQQHVPALRKRDKGHGEEAGIPVEPLVAPPPITRPVSFFQRARSEIG
jgi:hypothetical protein